MARVELDIGRFPPLRNGRGGELTVCGLVFTLPSDYATYDALNVRTAHRSPGVLVLDIPDSEVTLEMETCEYLVVDGRRYTAAGDAASGLHADGLERRGRMY